MVTSDRDFISNVTIVIKSCGFFANSFFSQFVIISGVVYIFNLLFDWLGVSCISQKRIVLDVFVSSGGTYFVPQNLLPIGCQSMGQHHLYIFLVDYMYVQYPLKLYVFYLRLRLPVESLGKQV